MATLKVRFLAPVLITVLFLATSLYFARKGTEGSWHVKITELWEKEDWHKLRALGENLHETGKADLESYYVAMLASQQLQDQAGVQVFASRIADSRALNWDVESRLAQLYRPDSLRKRIALFRTKIVFGASIALFVMMILSLRKQEPYKLAPALISAAGLIVFLL